MLMFKLNIFLLLQALFICRRSVRYVIPRAVHPRRGSWGRAHPWGTLQHLPSSLSTELLLIFPNSSGAATILLCSSPSIFSCPAPSFPCSSPSLFPCPAPSLSRPSPSLPYDVIRLPDCTTSPPLHLLTTTAATISPPVQSPSPTPTITTTVPPPPSVPHH